MCLLPCSALVVWLLSALVCIMPHNLRVPMLVPNVTVIRQAKIGSMEEDLEQRTLSTNKLVSSLDA